MDGRRYPLIEWGVTEAECPAYCKARGFTWGLYDHMDRVSCWCCPLQSLDSAQALRKVHPELWARLLEMERECKVLPNTFQDVDRQAEQV